MISFKCVAFALLALPLTVFSLPAKQSAHKAKVELLYQFPNGTWVENIALRSNDEVLVTLLSSPDLYAVDTRNPGAEPTLLHSFTGSTALFGIDEIAPDVFAVAAGNYSFEAGNTAGSYSIWKVDFASSYDNSSPEVSLIAAVPEVEFVNGLCHLPKQPGKILLGDIARGKVWRLDINTGKVTTAVPATNKLVSVGPDPTFGKTGVDGVHVVGDELYAANVGRGTFGKIKVKPNGSPVPGAKPVILERAADHENQDDFAVDKDGTAYLVTSQGNTIIEVSPEGERRLIAGDLNSTEIAEPTSVVISRAGGYKKKLFVSTGGGLAAPINGDTIVGGQVIAIELL